MRVLAQEIVAPKAGGAKLADGAMLTADGQPAGSPFVLLTPEPSSSPTNAHRRYR